MTQIKLPSSQQIESLKVSTDKTLFDYSIIAGGYIVMFEINGVIYACNQTRTTLHKSTDGGLTFGAAIFTTASYITAVHKTTTGSLIVFLLDKTVHRSTDDSIFTQVLADVFSPWQTVGVSSNGDVVLFAEYGGTVSNGTSMKVYMSANGGATWSAVITEVVGTNGFNHFHSVQYLGNSRWMATTGDGSIRWYESNNNGSSFTHFLTPNGKGQIFRTLGVHQINYNDRNKKIVWASDGGLGNEGIYSLDYLTPNLNGNSYTPDLIMPLPSVSYGLVGQGSFLLATTNITSAYKNNKVAYVYLSLNGGETWQIDKKFQVAKTVTDGGISNVFGPDSGGCYYLTLSMLENADYTTQTIKMTPNFESKAQISKFNNEGRRTTEVLIPKGVYSATNTDVYVTPPYWAKGAIFVCRVYTITGTGTPTLKFQTNHSHIASNTRGPYLESTTTTTNTTLAHYWVVGCSAGNKIDRIASVQMVGLPLSERMLVTLNNTLGTYSTGEGIEAEVIVTWLP